jgi:hypothetical protein
MSTFGGFFEIINNPQSANQIMLQPQLDYNSSELFNAFQAMDGYIQNFSNQTNFQTGGTDVKGYNKTLGGIEAIMAASKQKISYSNKINQNELKNMLFRMISNIFQFTKENIIVEIMEDEGINFYELTTKYNNNKAIKFTGIKKKNYKIYSLDEVAKLKYTCKIDFAVDDGNKYIRNQKLTCLDQKNKILLRKNLKCLFMMYQRNGSDPLRKSKDMVFRMIQYLLKDGESMVVDS